QVDLRLSGGARRDRVDLPLPLSAVQEGALALGAGAFRRPQLLAFLVAGLDEPPLRLEGGHVLMGELAAEIVERDLGGVEPLDEALVHGQPLAVALAAIGGG